VTHKDINDKFIAVKYILAKSHHFPCNLMNFIQSAKLYCNSITNLRIKWLDILSLFVPTFSKVEKFYTCTHTHTLMHTHMYAHKSVHTCIHTEKAKPSCSCHLWGHAAWWSTRTPADTRSLHGQTPFWDRTHTHTHMHICTHVCRHTLSYPTMYEYVWVILYVLKKLKLYCYA